MATRVPAGRRALAEQAWAVNCFKSHCREDKRQWAGCHGVGVGVGGSEGGAAAGPRLRRWRVRWRATEPNTAVRKRAGAACRCSVC